MLYTTEIIVKVPLDAFVKKMNNIDNKKHWQRGLQSTEHISGNPGDLGSKIKLNYKYDKRDMEIIETITKNDFPNKFCATYKTKGMNNIQKNHFKETEEGFTKWTSTNEFTPLSFSMRVMLFLMPRAFKKQSLKYMQDFKNFAENGISVSNA
ncbi:SRPBCC family protein [Psychroserpens ponticola]|uniref:SRPBCC family protein n=1 Tax=Psychroserpens ponticola TaxID=2932268 RepID=A0ABY7S177_9FLAO|nr:SRPBCC family protein [Psychroserpens ponticola]WCO02762.1 SRPBCC family protein [Psychroserpens ponticola]